MADPGRIILSYLDASGNVVDVGSSFFGSGTARPTAPIAGRIMLSYLNDANEVVDVGEAYFGAGTTRAGVPIPGRIMLSYMSGLNVVDVGSSFFGAGTTRTGVPVPGRIALAYVDSDGSVVDVGDAYFGSGTTRAGVSTPGRIVLSYTAADGSMVDVPGTFYTEGEAVVTALVQASVARRMVDAYSGALIRVRRSSDDAEADIGMTAAHELDTGALLLHARTGHITSGDAMYFPGVSGSTNVCTLPDATALHIASDITMFALIDPTVWSGSNNRFLVARYGASGNRSYYFMIKTAGTLEFGRTADGTTFSTGLSTTDMSSGFSDPTWVAVSWRQSDRRVQFWTAARVGSTNDLPATWTQFGSNRTTSVGTDIFAGTAPLSIGGADANTSNYFAGRIHRAGVGTGLIDTGTFTGALVGDVDFADADADNVADTFTCNTGQTATITRNGDSAYLAKIYDQSGSARDFAQATTASQPRIVDAGAIERDASDVPTARFRPGSETHHMDATVAIDGPASVVAVFSLASTGVAGSRVVSLGDSTDDDADGLAIAKGTDSGGASWFATSGAVDGPQVVAPYGDTQIATIIANGSTLATYADGTIVPTSPADADGVNVTTVRIGNGLQGSLQHGGTISEVQIYEGALT